MQGRLVVGYSLVVVDGVTMVGIGGCVEDDGSVIEFEVFVRRILGVKFGYLPYKWTELFVVLCDIASCKMMIKR